MTEKFLAVSTAQDEVARARRWACDQVAGFAWPTRWQPERAAVGLMVSELVTNAVRYAGGTVGLTLVFDARRLRILVGDDSRARPVLHPTAVSGHGLVVVQELAESWGVVTCPTGKQVWADLAAPGAVPARVPADRTTSGAAVAPQGCLRCSAAAAGDGPGTPALSRRWRTLLLRARRRTLPPCSRAVRRACTGTVRRVGSAKSALTGSRTGWGWWAGAHPGAS